MPDEYGDEDELNYIIEQGQLEAEQFGTYSGPFWKGRPQPAKWLNPPRPIEQAIIDCELRKPHNHKEFHPDSECY